MELEIQNLGRKFRGKQALSGLNLSLQGGQTWLLLGPNGSGKTTLMKLIAGLCAPSSGSLTLDGEVIGVATKRRVAYMPTENYFYSYMSVRDAGRYYRDFFDDFDLRCFEDMIARANLDAASAVRSLSSGESAKLRLALTLSRDAQLMMFDEPINGVDMLTRDWVMDEIAARRDGNRLMLISTHLVEQAEAVADHAAFLHHGELMHVGSMDALCADRSLADLYREIYGEVQPC